MQNKRLTGDAMCCEMIDCPSAPPGGIYCDDGTCYLRELYERLRYYEDLEEAGRYIVLAEPERAGVDRLRELAEADMAGRVEIVVHCGDCKYYLPVNGDCGLCDLQGGLFRPTAGGYCSLGKRKAQDSEGKEDKADAHQTETWLQRLKKVLPDCDAHSIVRQTCPGEFFSNGPSCDDCSYEDMPSIVMGCEKCWNQEATDE